MPDDYTTGADRRRALRDGWEACAAKEPRPDLQAAMRSLVDSRDPVVRLAWEAFVSGNSGLNSALAWAISELVQQKQALEAHIVRLQGQRPPACSVDAPFVGALDVIRRRARAADVPVIIDPKGDDSCRGK